MGSGLSGYKTMASGPTEPRITANGLLVQDTWISGLVITESWLLVPPKPEPQPVVLPVPRCGSGSWSQGHRAIGPGPTEARATANGLTDPRHGSCSWTWWSHNHTKLEP